LAAYTCKAKLEPEQTMDIGNFLGDSTLPAIIFAHPREGGFSFEFAGKKFGLLLYVGIAAEELNYARKNGGAKLLAKLKQANVFPYTEPGRGSVMK
jgi:hypothetical protein